MKWRDFRVIEGSMENRFVIGLNIGKRMLSASAATVALAGLAVIGMSNPPRGWAQFQPVVQKLEFDAVSVKPSGPISSATGRGTMTRDVLKGGPGTADPGFMHCAVCALADVVVKAYDLETYQLSGPAWLMDEVIPSGPRVPGDLEISAKVPGGTNEQQLRLMLQNLLADRFKLAVHREKKVLASYALMVGKDGPKLKESAETAPPAPPDGPPKVILDQYLFRIFPPGYPADGITRFVNGRYLFSIGGARATMAQLAQELRRQLNQPVRDETGFNGKYDFALYFYFGTLQYRPGTEPPNDPPTLSEGLSKLGLSVEAKKVPVDVLVVDHVEKVPTDN